MQTKTLEYGFFLLLLVLITLTFFALIQPFLYPLFWAAILAILFAPVYRYGLAHLGQRASLTAALTLVLILFIVILPLALLGVAVTREATNLYERLSAGDISLEKPLQAVQQTLPMVTSYAERVGIDIERLQEGLSSLGVAASQWLASHAFSLGQDTLRVGIMFCLMLYILYFFLRDGDRLVSALMYALPLGDERERRLFTRFAEVSRATIKGTLVVALVQGTIGGVAFELVGITAAVFWGAIMALLSLLPALGSALVWAPAAFIYFANGAILKGVILVAVGSLVIGLVDNVLRPILVGRDTRMPDYLVLIATLGGLTAFGVSGFVIGPLIAALFLSVWEMFKQEHQHLSIGQTAHDMGRVITPGGQTGNRDMESSSPSHPSP